MGKEVKTEKSNYQLNYLTREDIRNLLKKDIDTILNNIQRIMKEKVISQDSLATAMGSEQQHISYMLRKRGSGITIPVIGRIAAALNTTISELAK